MIILPTIDIKDGNCVRLFKGDFSTVEKVAADYMKPPKVLNCRRILDSHGRSGRR